MSSSCTNGLALAPISNHLGWAVSWSRPPFSANGVSVNGQFLSLSHSFSLSSHFLSLYLLLAILLLFALRNSLVIIFCCVCLALYLSTVSHLLAIFDLLQTVAFYLLRSSSFPMTFCLPYVNFCFLPGSLSLSSIFYLLHLSLFLSLSSAFYLALFLSLSLPSDF